MIHIVEEVAKNEREKEADISLNNLSKLKRKLLVKGERGQLIQQRDHLGRKGTRVAERSKQHRQGRGRRGHYRGSTGTEGIIR